MYHHILCTRYHKMSTPTLSDKLYFTILRTELKRQVQDPLTTGSVLGLPFVILSLLHIKQYSSFEYLLIGVKQSWQYFTSTVEQTQYIRCEYQIDFPENITLIIIITFFLVAEFTNPVNSIEVIHTIHGKVIWQLLTCCNRTSCKKCCSTTNFLNLLYVKIQVSKIKKIFYNTRHIHPINQCYSAGIIE